MAGNAARFPVRIRRPVFSIVIGALGLLLASSTAFAEASAAEGDISQWWRFASRFHLVFLHIPIGFLALAFIIEVAYGLFRPSRDARKIVGLTLVLSFLGSLVVAALGLMLSTEGGYDEESLFWHQWLGLGVVALALLCVVTHRRAHGDGSGWLSKSAYRGVLMLTLAAVVLTGHHGGNLTHGSQYLVKYAPGFFKNIVNAAETAGGARAIAAGREDEYFLAKIQPIFAAKCERCHGPEKQKGDYRLDVKEVAFGGGESAVPAITPGDPFRSELIRLILLPGDDDDVMPPKGKEALTPEEILELIHWVQKAAPFVDRTPSGPADVDAGSALAASEDAGAVDRTKAAEEAVAEEAVAEEAVAEEAVAEEAVAEEAVAEEAAAASPDEPQVEHPVVSPGGDGRSGAEIDFNRDVRPILERHCVRCHGTKKKGGLRLHTRASAIQGGKHGGPGITPGQPEQSSILRNVAIPPEEDEDELLMPPADDGGPLEAEQIRTLRQWIVEGASWPDELTLEETDDEE